MRADGHDGHPGDRPPGGPGRPEDPPAGRPEPPSGPTIAPWLEEQLYRQRIVVVHGHLTADAATRAAATLLTLDKAGAGPVQLHLSANDGDLAAMFAIVDTLDIMRAPVHGVARGEVGGAAVGVFVATGRRLAFPHALFRLTQPKVDHLAGTADEVVAAAGGYLRALEELVVRVAATCGQPRSRVEDDFEAGRVFDAEEARRYGLVDEILTHGRP
jgi:ATP-dependent Clp protease protease subunit